MIDWKTITSNEDVENIKKRSETVNCMIFKHSTTCSISVMAKSRLERKWDIEATEIEPYYLDLKIFKPVSNFIGETFDVHHESPQVLLIKDGKCFYDESHLDIKVEEIKDAFNASIR